MTQNNRVAIVTGAAGGIGRAIASRLAWEGHDVALLDLDPQAAETAAASITGPGRAIGIAADVTDPVAVTAALERTARELGPPVILVNNAGITRDNLLFKMSYAEYDAVLNVHLRGAFVMARETQRYMVGQEWGRIVNLSSVAALGNRGQSNYSAAKAGLIGLTKTLAIELGPFGVTSNAIAPGFIATEMTAQTASRLGMSFEQFKAKAAESIPVRRVGQPEDVASLASFLTSDDASFISGQVIYLAGGPRG